jgi:D-alanyl-D-alanine carboxypeptidase
MTDAKGGFVPREDSSAEATRCAGRPLLPSRQRALQGLLDAQVAKNKGRGGGVLRIESLGCGLVWDGASGTLAVDATPMRPDDTFEVASITKTFTATAVMQLVEDGRLDLDVPLSRQAPGLGEGLLVIRGHDHGPEITPRQLLGHTSGLPDIWSDPPFVAKHSNAFVRAFEAEVDRLWNPADVLAYARRLTPVGMPGERYHYSDTGYVLLGLLVERVTGKPLHAVLRERILSPLRMDDTTMSYREPAPAGRRESHRYEGRLDLFGQLRQSADWASGGLVSSARDLARFGEALVRRRLYSRPSTLDSMQAWHPTQKRDVDYGLGLFRVHLDGDAGDLWGHDGHGNAFMYVWPQGGWIFSGTLNQTANDWWPLVASVMGVIADADGGR